MPNPIEIRPAYGPTGAICGAWVDGVLVTPGLVVAHKDLVRVATKIAQADSLSQLMDWQDDLDDALAALQRADALSRLCDDYAAACARHAAELREAESQHALIVDRLRDAERRAAHLAGLVAEVVSAVERHAFDLALLERLRREVGR